MRSLILLSVLAGLQLSSCLYQPQTPLTTSWDQRNGKGMAYNVDTSLYPFARIAKGNQPEQITVTYQSPTSVVVNWVTGEAVLYNDSSAVTKANAAGVQSIVQFGAKGGSVEFNASGNALTYNQDYYFPAYPELNYNYTSGVIHHVALSNLYPDTEYYYRVGDGKNWSLPHAFTTLQGVEPVFEPYRIGVLADVGITENSTVTVAHLTESLPDVVTLIGDFCYADNLLSNGSIQGFTSVSSVNVSSVTYQPTWDQFYRWWSTLTSEVPFIAANGNHEYEQDVYNKTYNAYNARFNQTSDLSGSGNSRYYSVELPGIHFISLSAYDEYNSTSAQYKWLQADLSKYDRSKQPWLIVQFHPPVYNTYVSHYKEAECARLAWEPLFYQYGVDLILHGHVHSYERTNRVFNYALNNCGPVYITIGDAGNLEQLAIPMADNPGLCPAPSLANSPGSKFQGNCQRYSLQNEYANSTNNGYCPLQQPSWSAYREPSFGHGTLDVSPTQLVWSWHRNQDAEPVTTDTVVITQKDNSCPNSGGAGPAVAPISNLAPYTALSQSQAPRANPPVVPTLPTVQGPVAASSIAAG